MDGGLVIINGSMYTNEIWAKDRTVGDPFIRGAHNCLYYVDMLVNISGTVISP